MGARPNPEKFSEQPVPSPWNRSREVRFKRRTGSMRAAMRKREAIQPRKLERVEADAILYAAGRNVYSLAREYTGSTGVTERGEHAKVIHAYLGGLPDSAKER